MNLFYSIFFALLLGSQAFQGHSIPLKCYTTAGSKCKKLDVFEREFRRRCATPPSRCAYSFCVSNNCMPTASQETAPHSYWMCGTLCTAPEINRKLKASLSNADYLNYQLYYKAKENKKLYKALRTASFDQYSGKKFRETFSSFVKHFSLKKNTEKWCTKHCLSQGDSCPLLSQQQKSTCIANCSTFTKIGTKLKKCLGGSWNIVKTPFSRAKNAIQGSTERLLDNLTNYRNRHKNQPDLKGQTAHEKTVEEGISSSVEKLKQRYPGYAKLTHSILEKMNDKALFVKKSLSEDELASIQVLINRISKTSGDTKERLIEYLSLAYLALEDQKAVEMIFGHPPSEDEMTDRWVSWFKSALFDSQNAYALDRGGVVCSITGGDTSCWAGTWNRIIMALNLIHPDVEIAQGEQTEENILKYNQGRFTQTIPDKVKDYLLSLTLDELEAKSIAQSAREYMNNQAQKVFAYKGGKVPKDVTEGLDFYFDEGYFDEALEEALAIKRGTAAKE